MKCRDEGEGRIEGAAEQGFSTNSFANLAVLWNNDRKDERGPDERVQTRGTRREGPDEMGARHRTDVRGKHAG